MGVHLARLVIRSNYLVTMYCSSKPISQNFSLGTQQLATGIAAKMLSKVYISRLYLENDRLEAK